MGLSYVIDECPPWYLSIVLGFQVTSPVHKHLKPIETRHITTSWPYLTHAHSHTTIPSRSQTPCCLKLVRSRSLSREAGKRPLMLIKRIATSGIEIRDVSYLRPSPESRRLDNGVHESTPSKNYKNIQKFYLSVLLRFFFEFIAFIRCKSKFYM